MTLHFILLYHSDWSHSIRVLSECHRVIPKSRLYRIFFRCPWKSRLAIQKLGI